MGKTSVILWTLERLLPSVHPDVPSELVPLDETPATFHAGKWPPHFVQTLMLLQNGFIPGQVTFRALEGPLPHENGLVSNQAALHKVDLTMTAVEMLLTRNHPGPLEFRVPFGFVLVLWTQRTGSWSGSFCALSSISFHVRLSYSQSRIKSQASWNFLVTCGTHCLMP